MKRSIWLLLLCLIIVGCPSPRPPWIEGEIGIDRPYEKPQVKSFAAGSRAFLRVATVQQEANEENEIAVDLAAGNKRISLYKGSYSNKEESVNIPIELPADIASGDYSLEITSSTGQAYETVKIYRSEKILLVTDKPIYQPAQTIHIRSLVLNRMNLKPVIDKEVLFEVEDSKGNKVFKKRVKAGKYGIAATRFILADEVNMGDYRITATMDEVSAQKNVVVKKYVLPKFKIDIGAQKNYFLPGEKVEGTVRCDYFFGKPVAGGTIKFTASTFDVESNKFFEGEGELNANGTFDFSFPVPDYLVGQSLVQGKGLIKLELEVVDKALHKETKVVSFPVALHALQISLFAESGKLVTGVDNNLFVAVAYPDGTPVKDAVVKLNDTEKTTDAAGIVTIPINISSIVAKRPTQINVIVEDKQGQKRQKSFPTQFTTTSQNVLLRPMKAIYTGGQEMRFQLYSTLNSGIIYFDIIKEHQTVYSNYFDLKDGRSEITVEASPDLFGTLQCHAYKYVNGILVRDTRLIYVQPPNNVQIAIGTSKSTYRPGDEATLTFSTTDEQGKPIPAALGVTIVDEAVYALQEIQPGLAKVYFTLEQELMQPRYQIDYAPRDSLPTLMRQQQLDDARQQVATVLFSQIEPEITPHFYTPN